MEAVEKKKLRHELVRGDFSCQRSTESEPLPLACRLLLNTSEEVVQISEAVGYSSPRTFNRAFFKQTGVSPTEYRKTRSAKTQIRHFVSTATTSRIIESADKVIKQ